MHSCMAKWQKERQHYRLMQVWHLILAIISTFISFLAHGNQIYTPCQPEGSAQATVIKACLIGTRAI